MQNWLYHRMCRNFSDNSILCNQLRATKKEAQNQASYIIALLS